MTPSTSGTFLRTFTFGHVPSSKPSGRALARAWGLRAAPTGTLTGDVDATIYEVHGYQKESAAYGYTRVPTYHPLRRCR